MYSDLNVQLIQAGYCPHYLKTKQFYHQGHCEEAANGAVCVHTVIILAGAF